MTNLASRGADGTTRLHVGDATLVRVADIDGLSWPFDAMFDVAAGDIDALLSGAPPETVDRRVRTISLSFNSYLIRIDGLNVLVDCGIGNDKGRPDRPLWHHRRGDFLDRLSATGVMPDAIDVVVNTHLHADHVGWNTQSDQGAWRPTFANARYLTANVELDHWRRVYDADPLRTLHGAFCDSVLPLMTAGRLTAVDLPYAISPRLTLEAAPGHSPGMMVVRCRSGAGDVVVAADTIHHPLQFARPGLNSRFCEDPELAAATRRDLLTRCAAEGTIIAPYHFGAPAFGTVRATSGGAFAFSMLSEGQVHQTDR